MNIPNDQIVLNLKLLSSLSRLPGVYSSRLADMNLINLSNTPDSRRR